MDCSCGYVRVRDHLVFVFTGRVVWRYADGLCCVCVHEEQARMRDKCVRGHITGVVTLLSGRVCDMEDQQIGEEAGR